MNPIDGVEVSKLVDMIYQTPQASLDAAREAVVAKGAANRK